MNTKYYKYNLSFHSRRSLLMADILQTSQEDMYLQPSVSENFIMSYDVYSVLDSIFDECLDGGCDEAPVKKLAAALSAKFASTRSEQPELENKILKQLDPSNEDEKISRGDFLTKLQSWMSEGGNDMDERVEMFTSTPRRPTPHPRRFLAELFDENCNTSYQSSFENELVGGSKSQTEAIIQNIKDSNLTLQNRLTKSEQKNHSFEQKINALEATNNFLEKEIKRTCQQNLSLKNEMSQLHNTIAELQSKLKDYTDVSSAEHLKLQVLKEKSKLSDLKSKKEGAEQELELLRKEVKTTKSDLNQKDLVIITLRSELHTFQENELKFFDEIKDLKEQIEYMTSEKAEFLYKIEELRQEKVNLISKVEEMEALKKIMNSTPCSEDDLSMDDGLKSIDIINHPVEEFHLRVIESQEESTQTDPKLFATGSSQTESHMYKEKRVPISKDSGTQCDLHVPPACLDAENRTTDSQDTQIAQIKSQMPKDNGTQCELLVPQTHNLDNETSDLRKRLNIKHNGTQCRIKLAHRYIQTDYIPPISPPSRGEYHFELLAKVFQSGIFTVIFLIALVTFFGDYFRDAISIRYPNGPPPQ